MRPVPTRKILFISVQAWGHSVQMLALAREMQRRDYPVVFSLPERVSAWVADAGLPFAPWQAPPPAPGMWAKVTTQPHWRTEKLLISRHAERYPSNFLDMKSVIEREAPELVVCNRVLMAAADAADALGVKCVVYTEFLGDAFRPDWRSPQYSLPYQSRMSWRQRVVNAAEPVLARLRLLPELRALRRARRRAGVPTAWTAHHYRHPLLVGFSQALEVPRPLPPSVRVVGLVHEPVPRELPDDLRRWLDAAGDVVYIAQGTNVLHTAESLRSLRDGACRGDHQVLWSLPGVQQDALGGDLPPNLRLESTVPQMAVLRHRAVKLFVSHCGANSVGEALLAGVPILALPACTDQHYNAARIAERGIGLRLGRRSTADQIQRAVLRMLREPCFRAAAAHAARIAGREGGLSAAADFLEDAVAVGYEHLLLPREPIAHLGGTLMV